MKQSQGNKRIPANQNLLPGNYESIECQQHTSDQLSGCINVLNEQAESLRKIRQLMSHDIRQPLTCIMGLINAIRDDNYIFNKEWLGLLEKESNDLDSKIKSIVDLTY